MSNPMPLAYSPGLDGVIAGESGICWVDQESGLRYRGYDAEELAGGATYEEVAWLLLYGEMPTTAELESFGRQLNAEAVLPAEALEMPRRFGPQRRLMDVLRSGISFLASFDPDVGRTDRAANLRKSPRLIARMTSFATSAWRILHGQNPAAMGGDATLAERFLCGLNAAEPEKWRLRALDTVMIMYAEHEFNASTFAARVTASTLADMYSAIVSAIGALEGPLHGGANYESMKMLREIGSPAEAEKWVKVRLARHEKIMGFGHRVYKHGDSRVPAMRKLLESVEKQTGQGGWLEKCRTMERVMEQEKGLFANLDLYAAPVLHLLGIPEEMNTPLFACSRVAGWCAHVTEQQEHNRLIRPRCLYTGPGPRKYAPVGTVSV